MTEITTDNLIDAIGATICNGDARDRGVAFAIDNDRGGPNIYGIDVAYNERELYQDGIGSQHRERTFIVLALDDVVYLREIVDGKEIVPVALAELARSTGWINQGDRIARPER